MYVRPDFNEQAQFFSSEIIRVSYKKVLVAPPLLTQIPELSKVNSFECQNLSKAPSPQRFSIRFLSRGHFPSLNLIRKSCGLCHIVCIQE